MAPIISLVLPFYLDDHDGNGVELYFDLPRPQWPLRQDKLFILTGNNPLNFDRLLASVEGEEPQLQAPSGTDLGHLNLHVPDLVEAEQFYRDVLSFEMTAHIGPGGRFLATGGYHHQIAINNWSGKIPAPENAIGLISYRFTVPDAKTLLTLEERAKARHHQTRWAGTFSRYAIPTAIGLNSKRSFRLLAKTPIVGELRRLGKLYAHFPRLLAARRISQNFSPREWWLSFQRAMPTGLLPSDLLSGGKPAAFR